MDKYYTPEIEEFYVGFEFYLKLGKDDNIKWKPYIWNYKTTANLKRINQDILDGYIKIKYLDKEDIESLGFIKESIYSHKKDNDYYIEYNSEKPIYLDSIEIKNNQLTLFSGYIKNKSELKKLLKQLNIK